MKNLFLLILFIFSTNSLFCQKYKSRIHLNELSESTLKIYEEATNCWENTEESCIPIFKKMLQNAKKNKECIPCAEIELARGYFFEAEYDSTILILHDFFSRIPKKNEKVYLALTQDAHNLMGSSLASLSKFEEAIHHFIKCRKTIEKIGNKDQAALVKVNIGLVYNKLGNNKKAIKYSKEALQELQDLGVIEQNSFIASNISSFYTETNDDSVIYWANKTIEFAKREKSIRGEIMGYYLKASGYETENHDSALYYVNKAIPMAEKENLLKYLTTSYMVKANVLSAQNDYSGAKEFYHKAIDGYKKLGNQSSLQSVYKLLAEAAYANNDFRESAYNYKEFATLSDTLREEENHKLLEELNTKYETEKKEKQIAEQDLKLQKQKTILWIAILGGLLLASILGGLYYVNRKAHTSKLIQLQKEKENAILSSFIQGEERERNRISHELHDGVAAMIGAAKMSLESLPHLSEEKQKEQIVRIKTILENTHADVRHIAHNLLPTVLEKEGIIKATEHFANEVNQTQLINIIVEDHNSNADQINVQLQLMLFRVIQELINNIIKHSQAQNAQILFSQSQNGLHIEVTDDGIGFDGEIDNGNQGLYSISQRLKSIGGNFKFVKKNDRGMKAIAELKV